MGTIGGERAKACWPAANQSFEERRYQAGAWERDRSKTPITPPRPLGFEHSIQPPLHTKEE